MSYMILINNTKNLFQHFSDCQCISEEILNHRHRQDFILGANLYGLKNVIRIMHL